MKLHYVPLITKAIEEDLGKHGDITSDSVLDRKQKGSAVLISKSRGVLCGLEVFEDTFFYIDKDLRIETFFKDGDMVQSGDKITIISGSLNSILKAERTALNFIQRLSGIASMSYEFVREIEGTKAKILDTRKTLPGFRVLDKYAVMTGGAENHRTGLYDMFLIKDNHISASGGIGKAVSAVLEYKQKRGINSPVEIEVKSVEEFKEAMELSVDRIMLDNMDMIEIEKCVELNKSLKEPKKIEVSGNVSLLTVRNIAETGVDFISVGSLTHSVKAMDFSLLVRMEKN